MVDSGDSGVDLDGVVFHFDGDVYDGPRDGMFKVFVFIDDMPYKIHAVEDLSNYDVEGIYEINLDDEANEPLVKLIGADDAGYLLSNAVDEFNARDELLMDSCE